jgi:hypothetical protein
MRKLCPVLLIAVVLLAGATGLAAAISPDEEPRASLHMWDADILDLNRFSLWLTNYGIFGHDPVSDDAGGWWPSTRRNETYVYGAGLWVGGILGGSMSETPYEIVVEGDTLLIPYVLGGDTNVTCGYNPNSGRGEFVPADIDNPTEPSFVDEYDRVHIFGVTTNNYEWPLKTAAGKDSVVSLQDSYVMFNDFYQGQHFASENSPLEIVVEQQSYAWVGPLKEDILFMLCKVVNHSSDTIKQAYFGPCYDLDIGNESGDAANDEVGFVRQWVDTTTGNTYDLNMAYQYQEAPESGWLGPFGDGIPGVIATMFLVPDTAGVWSDDPGKVTPLATDTVFLWDPDNPEINDTILPGDPLGMTAFKIFTIQIDPTDKWERYLVMAGFDYRNIDPDDPWDSYDPFMNDIYGPGDKRFAQVAGPFDVLPNDTVNVTFAFFVGPDLASLYPVAVQVLDLFNGGFQGPKSPAVPDLVVTPLDRRMYLYWGDRSEVTRDDYYDVVKDSLLPNGDVNAQYNPAYREFDFEGYQLMRSTDGETWDTLGRWDLADGITMQYIDSLILQNGDVVYTDSLVLGDDSGLIHSYIDTSLINGLEYYYRLIAFDYNFANYERDGSEIIGTQPFSLDGPPAQVQVAPTSPPVDYQAPGVEWEIFGYTDVVDPNPIVVAYDSTLVAGDYYLRFDLRTKGTALNPPDSLLFYVEDDAGDTLFEPTHLTFASSFVQHTTDDGTVFYTEHWTAEPVDEVALNGFILDLSLDVVPDSFFYDIPDTLMADSLTDTTSATWELYMDATDTVYIDSFIGTWVRPRNRTFFYPSEFQIKWVETDGGDSVTLEIVDIMFNDTLEYEGVNSSTPTEGWCFWTMPGWRGAEKIAKDELSSFTLGKVGFKFKGSPRFQFVGRPCALPPADGTIWTIPTFYQEDIGLRIPLSPEDGAKITITAPEFLDDYSLDDVNVVPNPYLIMTPFDPSLDLRRGIRFTHLPSECTIRIYTLAGDLIKVIEHETTEPDGDEWWNLLTEYDQRPASGIYLYHVETPDGEEKIGKLAVIF